MSENARRAIRVLHVLAAGIEPADLDAETVRRCQAALRILAGSSFDVVVVSGGFFRAGQVRSAAEMMAEWFIDRGIPEDQLILEGRSVDTYENVLFALEDLRRVYGDRPLHISTVSNPLHAMRAFVLYVRSFRRFVRLRPAWYLPAWRQIPLEFIGIALTAIVGPHAPIFRRIRDQRRNAPT